MACIHYKFKNSLDFDSITFDGLHISVRDLKIAIMQRKKLNDTDMDLLIINALNAKAYKDEAEMIPKNASVIVARIPLADAPRSKGPKTLKAYVEDPKPLPQVQLPNPTVNRDNLSEAADLVTAVGSEEDKIKAMMKQSTKDFDPANYQKKLPTGTPSPSYVCFKCNRTGHFIHNCPNAAVTTTEGGGSPKTEENLRRKRPTGIPHTFLTTANKSEPGAMSLGDGRYAVPTIDQEAFKKGKKERPPFLPALVEEKKEDVEVPSELKCLLCKDLLTDAVVIPCCGNSYCDECIRNHLVEDEDHKCPTCHEENVSPDKLIINKSLRISVNNFKNETLYQKQDKKSLSPPPPPPPRTSSSVVTTVSKSITDTTVNSVAKTTVTSAPLKLDTSVKTIDLTSEPEPATPVLDEKTESEEKAKGIAVLGGRAPITTTSQESAKTTSSYRSEDSKPAISTETYTPAVPIPSLGGTYRPHMPPASMPNIALPPPGYRPLLYPPSIVPPPPPFGVPPGFIPPQVAAPLSKHEFYREQKRLQGKPNPLDDYTRPSVSREQKKRSKSKSPKRLRSKSRSRSKSPRAGSRDKKSFSRTPPPKKRSYTKSRSRSPYRKKKSYSRSRSRSLTPRKRSRSPRPRTRSRSWTPKKFRGRSRSYTRSRSRSRSRTPRLRRRMYSRSPPPRRRSFSRSLTPRRRSYSRSPPRRRSKSPFYRGRSRSPGYYGRDWQSPPYRGYRSPPPRGFSPPRYGGGPQQYNYGGRNEYPARFDQRIYEEIFQDYIARFGLPPPPPPGQTERGMYFDPHKGVYRGRSRSRSPKSSRRDRNKDRKDDKQKSKDTKSKDKDRKTSDKSSKTEDKSSKSRNRKDSDKSKAKDEKTKDKENKAKEKKPEEKTVVRKDVTTEGKASKSPEKKIIKKVKLKDGTIVKKESIALRLKTKATAGKMPVKSGPTKKPLTKETESSDIQLNAINKSGALKTISKVGQKEIVHSKSKKNSNLIEINAQVVLPEVKDIPNEEDQNKKDEPVQEPMETSQTEVQKPIMSENKDTEDKMEVDSAKEEIKKTSPKKVKVVKKVKKVKKLVDVDASQSDSASDLDKVKSRKKKRVEQINENDENSQDESPAKRIKQESGDELNQKENGVKSEDQLMLSPPELSKWEREDYSEDKSPDLRDKLKKKSDKKPSLPRSVIESAEKAITQKQPKPATVASAIVPAVVQKKVSVHDRLQKSPVRQTESRSKKSPVRQQRRVYMDDIKQNHKSQIEEENRKVQSKESSMQITISSDKNKSEKDGQKRRERRDSETDKHDRRKKSESDKLDKHRGFDDEKVESRKHSVDEKSEKYSKKSEKEKVSTKEREDKNQNSLKEKKSEHKTEKLKSIEKDISKRESEAKKPVNGQDEDKSEQGDDTDKQIIKKKKYERKESIIDESTFVPDYNEHSDTASEAEGSSASHAEAEEADESEKLEKKQKKLKKEKKHKKDKKHKHKHKKKKHKKHKEEKESTDVKE